jgi:hypothetical protein
VTSAGFDRPDAPGRDPDAPQFDMEHNLGQLLVLRVIGQQQTETEYGVRPVVVADVFVMGPENGGVIRAEYPESWLFGTVLHSQLRGKIGRTVVGLLEQGEKRPGRKPPWRLNGEVPPQAEQAAMRAMMARPEPAQQQPQQPAWGQTPAAGQQGGPSPWETQQQPAHQDPWTTQQPAQQPGPWGQQPLPTPPPAGAPAPAPWGQAQPAAAPPAPWEQPAATPGGAPPF